MFSHEFLIVTASPSLLLGRDILSMVQASFFMNMKPTLFNWTKRKSQTVGWWKNCGLSTTAVPVIIKLKDPHLFPYQKQYSLKPEVKEGLKLIIDHLKAEGLLIPCNSPYSTPILGVNKSNDKWKLVQVLAGQEAKLELDMEQKICSILGKEYIKAVYCHPSHLTYM